MSMFDAVLFDLGQVIFNIDFSRAAHVWARHSGSNTSDLMARFKQDHHYEQHEVAAISTTEYFDSLRRTLGINISDEQFLEGWNAIFMGEVPNIERVLSAVKKDVPIFAFTNTNTAHEAHITVLYAQVLRHFETVFASSNIGLRKPDVAAFEHVAGEIGTGPDRILFFDDSAANIDGARASGMHGVQVLSPQCLTDGLKQHGLLTG